jgi:hypothetical protein
MFGHPAGMATAFQRIALEILMESKDGLVNSRIQSSIFNSGRVYKVASKSFMITISTWYPFRHFHFPSPPSADRSSTLPNAQKSLVVSENSAITCRNTDCRTHIMLCSPPMSSSLRDTRLKDFFCLRGTLWAIRCCRVLFRVFDILDPFCDQPSVIALIIRYEQLSPTPSAFPVTGQAQIL